MKVSKKNIQTWVKALRSGKYMQGQSKLQVNAGFCCLGVACKLFIPEKYQSFSEHSPGMLYGCVPSDQDHSPEWLDGINDDFEKKTGAQLTRLNDGIPVRSDTGTLENMELDFNEIADLLEAVYILEVLNEV